MWPGTSSAKEVEYPADGLVTVKPKNCQVTHSMWASGKGSGDGGDERMAKELLDELRLGE